MDIDERFNERMVLLKDSLKETSELIDGLKEQKRLSLSDRAMLNHYRTKKEYLIMAISNLVYVVTGTIYTDGQILMQIKKS